MLETLFWLSVAGFAYAYVGFPALVIAMGVVRGRPVERGRIRPTVSVLIAAYNEAGQIQARLRNALAAEYPPDRLEVIVASDGSTDGTDALVEGFADPRVRLLSLPRGGKLQALDAAARAARGEILVFSDANTVMDPEALSALAENFADPEVGGVAGYTGYRLDPGTQSSGRGEGLYWRYDTWLKEMESRTGSVVSAHGGLYGIRRELYRTPTEPSATDDFIISTEVVAQGRRLVFEPRARAYEIAIPVAGREFSRRVRLMTRGLRGVAARRELLDPFRFGFYAVVLFSHKVVRRLAALGLPVLLITSLLLANTAWFYAVIALGQIGFYGLAGVGALLRGRDLGQQPLLYVPFYYCMANGAAVLALARFLRGDRIHLWQPQRHAVGG